MGKSKMDCKKLESLTGAQKCVFCNTSDIDEMRFGPVYMHKNIITHYYCLLLSSNMEQNGRDSDGILGFFPSDITKEVRRGMRLYCSFCRSGGATLGCAVSKCKVVFHLPCGMKHGTLHQFFGEFKSYCAKHRPVQKINEKVLAESSKGAICGICYEKVVPRPIHETLWAPCCQKNAFFHRDCVQKLATSAGYFFKCPLCNNTNTFQQAMKDFGIYIPEQDASWERVPDAYQDLLVRHETCDSASCSCPSGRKTNVQGTRWELILCKFCGSQGIHIGCGRLKWKSPEFECDICTRSAMESQEGNRSYNRHRLSGLGRTADIHPSVSADREREPSESSDDSALITISNKRRKVISPIPQPAKNKTHPTNNKASHVKMDMKLANFKDLTYDSDELTSQAIVIDSEDDDDDDDVELVSETKGNSSCLKTNDGSTIPVVQMGSVQKRLRVEGDVKVLPDEIVDITIQMPGPPAKKAPSPPPIKELVYSLPPQQPSTSTAYSAPSTSFAQPDLSRYVLVDSSTLRPEDLPPGLMLYRSMQPVVNVPQTPVQPQMQSQLPNNLPMQQLGAACYADAKHPDLSEHRARGCHDLNSKHLKKYFKKISRTIKHNCSRRRGRGFCRCYYNRLDPEVTLRKLQFRLTSDGYHEILVPGRYSNVTSRKRKASPLPSRPMKKMKFSKNSTDSHEYGTSSLKKKQTKRRKTSNKAITNKESKTLQKKNENNIQNSKSSSKITANCSSKWAIANFFNPLKLKTQKRRKKNCTKDTKEENKKESIKRPRSSRSPVKSSPECNVKSKKKKTSLYIKTEWKCKRIDHYLRKLDTISSTKQLTTETQEKCSDGFQYNNDNEKNTFMNTIIDEIIDLAIKSNEECQISKETSVTNHSSTMSSNQDDIVENNDDCITFPESSSGLLSRQERDSLSNVDSRNITDNTVQDIEITVNDKIHVPPVECNVARTNEQLEEITGDIYKHLINDNFNIEEKTNQEGDKCNVVNDGTKYTETYFNFEGNLKTLESSNSCQQLFQSEEMNTHQNNIKNIASSVPPKISKIDCKNPNKYGNGMYGFFPKIKMSYPANVKSKQSKCNYVKKYKKLKNINKANQMQEDEKISKNNEMAISNKTKKVFKQDITNAVKKMTVIDHYFSAVKKDVNASLGNNQYFAANGTSCSNFEKERSDEVIRKEVTFAIGNINLTQSTNKSGSPEKTPLVELQFNVIPNL